MRTTVVLPPHLLRAAKVRSAEHGESLKALLTRAIEAELGREPRAAAARARVALPLFGDPDAPIVRLSNADLARALADADRGALAAANARARRPPRRPR